MKTTNNIFPHSWALHDMWYPTLKLNWKGAENIQYILDVYNLDIYCYANMHFQDGSICNGLGY